MHTIFPSDRLRKLRYGCTIGSFWAACAIWLICSRVKAPAGSVFGYGNYATANATTVITPPQTFNIHKPAITLSIKMSNDSKSLEPFGTSLLGQKAHPKDAAFLSNSLRQFLGIKSASTT